MKTQFETIGGYPTIFATNEEKLTNEYGLQYFKKDVSRLEKQHRPKLSRQKKKL